MIKTILNRLQTILEDEFSLTVYQLYPSTALQTDMLPATLLSSGRATYSYPDASRIFINREFYIDLYIKALNLSEREVLSFLNDDTYLTYLDTIPLYFNRSDRLNKLNRVKSVRVLSDNNLGTAGYDKTTYIGTRFILDIQYIMEK